MSFCQLPPELHVETFHYLSPPELAEARLVCQNWNSVSQEKLEKIRDLFLFTRARNPVKASGYYLKYLSIILKKYCQSQLVAAILRPLPESLQGLRKEIFSGLIQDDAICLEGKENETYEYDFTTLKHLILEHKSPISLHMNKLRLCNEHLSFLDSLVANNRISQLSFTKDKISAAKIFDLKRKMEFFEDGIDECCREPASLLIFVKKDP